ncbi:putative mitochondrial hypothetical protein [Leptomonas pyrrhocoris]|uniref:Uncharacterized protein n=1 Tax=Leptomonas pyrrhocoris TaxID=157538 RepID=A0A0M9FVV9_LEPPY|nr:putative mitochondrial hypothetical protein [Leptomonas pyrrhocoris]XP_015655395.1 putative mitochondrial hypothetical protein [Leptomonas pyrrhocoris]KPA76955.1 putative mitochondrial hypothetical protein [Leptomonas pyrrhocoris]KPA76956.1 putative mitochondrial hypothetical protein [Leptomonas pyrrhocoris]|eukprot:XP_015655394.1 putative mitochondrial hypothetical protein [Leptomonas pyrrhocoris]
MRRILQSPASPSVALSINVLHTSNALPCSVEGSRKHFSGGASAHTQFCCRRIRDPRAALTAATARGFSSAALTVTRVTCGASPSIPASASSTTTQTKSAALHASAPLENGAAELPVSRALIQEIQLIMSRHAAMKWMPVSDLYADLSPRTRREHVRPHKSMLQVLQKAKSELGISINATGVFYAVGRMPVAKHEPKQTPQPPQQLTKSVSAAKKSPSPAAQLVQRGTTAATAADAATSPSPLSVLEGFIAPVIPRVDFFFDVQLEEFPLPPSDFDVTPAHLQRQVTRSSADGAVIAMSDFVAYIPPFFAPLRDVLAHMPGYTEEHIQRYFRAGTMEVVTVDAEKYIRVHSGYEKLSLAGCEAAEETFRQFRPLPSLAVHFEKAFEGMTDKWMPLPVLLSRVDPAVVAQLPFQGPSAVMYFAQMQHKFAFAVRHVPPQQDGAAATTEAAVLLRRPDYGGLECDTTPTPKVVSYLFSLIPQEGQVEMCDVARQLPGPIKAELEEYYGGLAQFFAKHAPLYYVPPETPTVVMRLRYRQRFHIATRPLEEQLKYAMDNNKKSKVRVIRRRIAFRDNPSHPFLDPENLAKELSNHLPRRGFVSVKVFLSRGIPEELVMFMPPKVHNFFKNYPQFFTQFEYQKPGVWCLCRPDQPLPRGVIRQSFSESDLVRMLAEYLQKKGPRSVSNVLLNTPRGAQEILKKRYGGVYFFVTRFPQYFHVVLGSDNGNAQSSGIVHLIQVPSAELDDSAMANVAGSLNNPDAPTTDLSTEKLGETELEGEDGDDDYDGLD